VEHFRRLKWDTTRLHDASPFQVVDPGFNAILIRSCADLADLAEALGYTALAAENRSFADRGLAAMESLWSAQHGQYLCLDRVQDALIDSASVGGILAVFAAIPAGPRRRDCRNIDGLDTRFRVASHTPEDPRYDGKRYWRAPYGSWSTT